MANTLPTNAYAPYQNSFSNNASSSFEDYDKTGLYYVPGGFGDFSNQTKNVAIVANNIFEIEDTIDYTEFCRDFQRIGICERIYSQDHRYAHSLEELRTRCVNPPH